MKKWLRWLALLCVLLTPAALLMFFNSAPGLRCLVALCNNLSAGRLTIDTASGSLFNALHLQGIRYADTTDSVAIDTLTVTWDPMELLNKRLQINSLRTSGVRVTLGRSELETITPAPFSVPICLSIQEIFAEMIAINYDQEEVVVIQSGLSKQLSLQGHTLAVEDLTLSTQETTLHIKGQLQTTKGYPAQWAFESLSHPAGYEPIAAKGSLTGPLNSLALDVDFLTPIPVHLQGRIDNLLGDLTWQARLDGTTIALRAIHPDWPDQTFTQVAIDAKGTLAGYTLHLHSLAGLQQLEKPVALSADLQGNHLGFQVTDLLVAHEKTSLAGKGALHWSPGLSWQAEVSGAHIDPGLFLANWPGDFSCSVNTTGRFIGNELEASFLLAQLQGTLRGFPLSGKGEVFLKGPQLQIPQLVVTSAGSTLRLSGKTNQTVDLAMQLDSNNLAELWPNAKGKIHARGRLTGNLEKPEIDLQLAGTDVGLGKDGAGKLTVAAQGALSREGRFSATVKADLVRLGDTVLQQSWLNFKGSINDHTISIGSRNAAFEAGLILDGKTTDQGWQAALRQTHLSSMQFGEWRQRQATTLTFAEDNAAMQPLCLASPSSGNFCLNGSWSASSNTWQLHGTISSVPMKAWQQTLSTPWPIEGQMSGSLDLTGRQSHLVAGKLQCNSAGMTLQVPLADGNEHQVQWRKNTMQADYANNQLHALLDSELTDNSTVHMDIRLANLQLPGADLRHTPLQGSIQLHIQDLSPLAVLTEQMVNLTGAIRGQLTLNGTPATPLVTGQVELTNGKAEIPPLGITLSPLRVTLKGDNNTVVLQATAHSGSGSLDATGNLHVAKTGSSTNTVVVTGAAFKAARLPGLDLDISPDLVVTVGEKQTDIRGTVAIPRARITSIDFYNSTALSSDMIVIDDEREPDPLTASWPVYSSVAVTTGEDVQIDAYGLQGTINGKLQVLGQLDRLQVGSGTLSIKNGSFTLYGQRLKINLGRLLFTGGPLTNPGIELRSENNKDKVTTGVIIEGLLQHPEISFYSNPHMEQSAIVSRLLENTSIGGSTRQDTGFIGKAITKTGLGGMVPYLQNAKRLTMIDDIKLETGKNFDSLSLVFGSWLTSNFYVSYGKNLQKESGNFSTRYTLGRGFYFTTETGELQSGGDVKYEFEH